jgi:hypothetical protein
VDGTKDKVGSRRTDDGLGSSLQKHALQFHRTHGRCRAAAPTMNESADCPASLGGLVGWMVGWLVGAGSPPEVSIRVGEHTAFPQGGE